MILAARAGLLVLVLGCGQAPGQGPGSNGSRLPLHSGWTLQSSCKMQGAGERISTPEFKTTGWHDVAVPSTVVAALVADKTYPDPYFGMNLRKIPGTTYPIGKIFTEIPMPRDSPFRCSWWYRTEFRLPESFRDRRVWLTFGGINYRANVWLNGRRIASDKDVVGMYRTYEFDVTPEVLLSKPNVLAVETFAQTETDLGINFQDWNPAPPDKDMGLFGEVYLTQSGPAEIRSPQVVTHFPVSSLDSADLTVVAQLRNSTGGEVAVKVQGSIDKIHFQQTVTLKPHEERAVRFTPRDFPQLHVEHPSLWWPAQMGPQNLHTLHLRATLGDTLSDAREVRFGIREFTSELTEKGYRLFRVNGKRILIRGGGWTEDMLLRRSRERVEQQFQYVLDMRLNVIRLEGQIESDDFFDLADEQGILIMPGWVCCSFWQSWEKWKPEDLFIAVESLRSQILRLRSHPSVFVWLNASDVPAPKWVEGPYQKVLNELDWPNPVLSSASAIPAELTGPSGVKMSGPYDYVPPSYWLEDPGKYGGAYGFNTETGPGAAIPPAGSLEKMLPPDKLWPVNEYWRFHSASNEFASLNVFSAAVKSTFGPPGSLEDFLKESQLLAYDGERAMFEAWARNKYTSTGVIHWMLNNAWPSVFWHLYDYYLQPAGGYFGTKKACEPLHIQYSYDDRSVVVVNGTYGKISGLTATAALYNFDLRKKFSESVKLDMGEDAVQRILTVPPLPEGRDGSAAVYFLKLTLEDSKGKLLSTNFYWLSTHPAKIEWKKTVFFDNPPPPDLTYASAIYTPASAYDDLSDLKHLPRVRLNVTFKKESDSSARVTIQNSTDDLAFQLHLGIHRKRERAEILPVLWDDNYFSLLPGESREVAVRYLSPNALQADSELAVDGWNVEPVTLSVASPDGAATKASGKQD